MLLKSLERVSAASKKNYIRNINKLKAELKQLSPEISVWQMIKCATKSQTNNFLLIRTINGKTLASHFEISLLPSVYILFYFESSLVEHLL